MPDLENLITRLIRSEVEFIVIGGFAAFAHGSRLPTEDVGVCCDFSADNLMRLQAALSDLHPVHRMPPARPALELTPESCRGLKNLYLDTDYGPLDCLSFVEGVGDFAEVKRNSVEVQLAEGACRILSLDALIRSKEALGRPRDREAILQLKAIRERPEQE
jgi:hypothetical protein